MSWSGTSSRKRLFFRVDVGSKTQHCTPPHNHRHDDVKPLTEKAMEAAAQCIFDNWKHVLPASMQPVEVVLHGCHWMPDAARGAPGAAPEWWHVQDVEFTASRNPNLQLAINGGPVLARTKHYLINSEDAGVLTPLTTATQVLHHLLLAMKRAVAKDVEADGTVRVYLLPWAKVTHRVFMFRRNITALCPVEPRPADAPPLSSKEHQELRKLAHCTANPVRRLKCLGTAAFDVGTVGGHAVVLDVKPFGTCSALLFDWTKDRAILHSTSPHTVTFRT